MRVKIDVLLKNDALESGYYDFYGCDKLVDVNRKINDKLENKFMSLMKIDDTIVKYQVDEIVYLKISEVK